MGDNITVLLTNEDGKVTDIIDEKMVMIEVKGVKFPAYTSQIDFPYFKMFTEKKIVPKKKIFIDDVRKEKPSRKVKTGDGVLLSFVPVFDKDVFDDDIVEKFKIYLINQNEEGYEFTYNLYFGGENNFQLKNKIEPLSDFYLHDVNFDDISDNPRFEFEFSLAVPDKRKSDYFEANLKLKGKQLFKKIEELQIKNEASFAYPLFDFYPDKTAEQKIDPITLGLNKLGSAGFRIYDSSHAKKHLTSPRSVVDLHIDKLTDSWKHLTPFEILTIQLKAFEKFYDAAVAHYQPSLIVIHGVGEGRLKDEIHHLLKLRKEVSSFVNQHHPLYGYGATEIFFKY